MIDILLSTYNGEKYITQQLQSLFAQTVDDWILWTRDDGSTDNTVAIIETFRQQSPNKIKILQDTKGNVGSARSFEILLEQSTNKYIMFCDQDDVWLPTKIEWLLQKMHELENATQPIAVFSDLQIVDSELQLIHPSFLEQNKLRMDIATQFKYICVANCVAGCTILMNQEAKKQVLPFPAEIPMFDWWIAAKIARVGILDYIPDATILYRQHSHNVWGTHTVSHSHYLQRLRHIGGMLKEYRRLAPFLRALEFGNMWRFWWYKLVYFIRRRL